MDSSQAIIVKKIKKGGHGHHGGAWKVAFADFVTAMMAFFLLMWLLGSTTPQERAAISDYFENPSAVQGPGGASTSMIKLGAVDQDKASGKDNDNQQNDGSSSSQQTEVVEVDRDAQAEKVRLNLLKQDLEQAIEASEALKKFKDQLLLDITAEGLRIQIIDKENRPMFDSGSSHLKSYSTQILKEIAKIVNKVPNKISLTGHTDATPYNSMRGYTNWELSTDRANASRRALVLGGLDSSKVAKVVGLSSTVLFDKAHPRSPVNRRISMIVMNKQTENALLRDGEAQVQSGQQAEQLLAPNSPGKSKIQRLAPKPLPRPGSSKPKPLPLSSKANPKSKKASTKTRKQLDSDQLLNEIGSSSKSSFKPIQLPVSKNK
ncbi:flagellar motor protein MotB [Kaarinaea lacus]